MRRIISLLVLMSVLLLPAMPVFAQEPLVDVVSLRTENSKTYDLGNGNYKLVASTGAIHYKDSGNSWQDIDPDYSEPDSGSFTASFDKLPYVIRMGDDGYRRIYPDRNDLSYWIDIGKPFPNMGMPVKDGGYWVWDYPNATMKIQVGSSGVKLNFILKNATAPTSISFPFAVEGITRNGRYLLHNGEVVAELVKPFAIDANGTYRDVDISFADNQVSLSLDTAGLVFPVDIDPTLTVQPTSKDTYLYQSLPNNNYGTANAVYLWNRVTLNRRGLWEFSLAGLPADATLSDATLTLPISAAEAAAIGKTVWAYKLTRTDWVETQATWNNYKTGNAWTSAGGDYVTVNPAGGSSTVPAAGNDMNFNVLDIVQDAYDTSIAAEFLVKYATEGLGSGYGLTTIDSKEWSAMGTSGKLVINYTTVAPPAAPANVAATDGTYTDRVVLTWTQSANATGYKVYEGVNLLDTLGDVATYDDTDAPAPTITAGSTAASDGDYPKWVRLLVAGDSTTGGASRTYTVVAFNDGGDSPVSDNDTGYRGVGDMTYQWWRSLGDSDAAYVPILGTGITNPYDDQNGVIDPDGRYYKAELSATGATSQNTTADRGYMSTLDKAILSGGGSIAGGLVRFVVAALALVMVFMVGRGGMIPAFIGLIIGVLIFVGVDMVLKLGGM